MWKWSGSASLEVVHLKGMLPLDLQYLQELASSAAVSLSPAKGCKILEHCPVQKTEIVNGIKSAQSHLAAQ